MAAPALELQHRDFLEGPRDPDRSLVLRAQRELPGDSASYRTLVERHRGAVYRRAYQILGSGADAEEAAQEAFLSVFKALPTYRPEKPFSHWLSVIVLNACRMIIRQRAQERRRREQFRVAVDHRAAAAGQQRDPILCGVLSELLGELPESTRVAILMRVVEERPHREIAERLQMTESAVKMRISRGWMTLRARYEERLELVSVARPC